MELVRTRDERSREEVYELLGLRNTLPEDALNRRDLFWKGIIYYREQLWDDALDHFRAALPADGIDAPLLSFTSAAPNNCATVCRRWNGRRPGCEKRQYQRIWLSSSELP